MSDPGLDVSGVPEPEKVLPFWTAKPPSSEVRLSVREDRSVTDQIV